MARTKSARDTQTVTFEHGEDGVGFLWINVQSEPVNVINHDFIESLESVLPSIEEAARTRSNAKLQGLILISARPGGFLAGADLKVLRGATSSEEIEGASRRFQVLLDRLEKLPVTTVAAIEGAALGGGLEVALACDYRVAAESTSRDLGLVEVQLGLLPAGGGTVRLPKLVGLAGALAMILGAKRMAPRQAERAGFVDEVVHPLVLEQAARKWAGKPKHGGSRQQSRLMSAMESTPFGRMYMYRQARASVMKVAGDRYAAPFLALDAIRHGRERGRDAGLDAEARHFGTLGCAVITRNLLDTFLETNDLKREQRPPKGDEPTLDTIGIIGAGLMGAGIAQASALSGMRVRLRDVDGVAVAAGFKRIHRLVSQARRSRRITRYEAQAAENRVTATTGLSGFDSAHLVIEAVVETREVKRKIVRQLEEIIAETAIIGTNTSAIPIGDIAAEAKHPERVVGIHFFSPVHRMPLVEVVRGPKSSDCAVAGAVAFGRKLGKNVVVVGDGPGFYTTRVLGFMMAEAVRIFEEGTPIETIDQALLDFGFPMGPMALMDEVGLDVGAHVSQTLAEAFPHRLEQSMFMASVIESGRTGRKAGGGFYVYDGKVKNVDPDVAALPGRGTTASVPEAIIERLSLSFVNEAAHCLSERIIANPRDGDLAAIYGVGFPPFLGGPFRYCDIVGSGLVIDRLAYLAEQHGVRFGPARSLIRAHESGRWFRESSRDIGGRAMLSSGGRLVGIQP